MCIVSTFHAMAIYSTKSILTILCIIHSSTIANKNLSAYNYFLVSKSIGCFVICLNGDDESM